MPELGLCVNRRLAPVPGSTPPHFEDDRLALWGNVNEAQLMAIRAGLNAGRLDAALASCNLGISLVILDKVRGLAFLVRDPLGVTTVLYSMTEGGLAVADSAARLQGMGLPVSPDYVAGAEFVMTHYRYHRADPNRTLFEGVAGLAPGELLEWSGGFEGAARRYWTPTAKLPLGDESEWFAKYRSALTAGLEDAVLGLDNPAFALSSGMDSGTIASLATSMFGPLRLVTTRFDDETVHDESAEVAPTAEALGGEWIQIAISAADVRSAFRQVGGDFSDWPASTVTQVLHKVLLERLRERGVDGLISGLGGDEVNCGEIEEYLYYFADLMYASNAARLAEDMVGWARYHSTSEYPKNPEVLNEFLATQVDLSVPGRILPNLARYWHYADCLTPEVRNQLNFSLLEEPYDSYLLNKLFQDLFYETIPPVLDLEQWNSKSSGVATRYPFLTPRMVDIGFSTDIEIRYAKGVSKAALRRATPGMVPDSARLNYYKRGWNAPLDMWLRESMASEVRSLLSSHRLQSRGTYNLPRIVTILNEHMSGTKNHMMFLWQFISYERWLSHFEE